MDAFERIAEERIARALAAGELDNPLAGQPLCMDDDARVPADLRLSYRALVSAGCLPPELEARQEALRLGDLCAAAVDDAQRRERTRAQSAAWMRYELLMQRRGLSPAALDYREQLRARLGGGD